jgi:hypothetical protein
MVKGLKSLNWEFDLVTKMIESVGWLFAVLNLLNLDNKEVLRDGFKVCVIVFTVLLFNSVTASPKRYTKILTIEC